MKFGPHLIVGAAIVSAVVSTPHSARAGDNGTLTMEVENDYFSPDNRDRHYSNGLKFGWLPNPSPDGEQSWLERQAKDLPFGSDDSVGRVGWSLGQNIYTPQNKKAYGPIAGDRPYAAWLYAGLSLINAPRTDPTAPLAVNELDSLEIDLGVVGRAALGQVVQNSFHDFAFGNEHVNGWRNQLKSEPALLISYDHKWQALAQTNFWGLGADLTPSVGFDLGNVMIDAAVGGMIRIGRDLPADWGPPRIRPGLSGSDFFLSDTQSERDFGWYVFAGAEGRAVAHNIFLDGNSFAKSLSVPKKTLVADFQVGVAFIVYGVRLTAQEVIRTQEFKHQHGTDQFGAISVSFNF
ncbi:MAG TPA: lipid A deacylase LpxR family protein [Alphaproteobacteria bacterium]|nr:lipid A deacylase LpxR family protein [Alphaproteobacteria bacterium]